MPHVEPQRFRWLMVRAISLPVLLLALLTLLLTWEVKSLLAVQEASSRSSLLLGELARARQLFIDRETGVRGYLLTGDEKFLEPYERAGELLPVMFERLGGLLEPSAEQRARQQELLWRWQDWEQVAKRELALYPRGEHLVLVRAGEGKKRMDAIRQSLDEIESVERQHAKVRTEEAERQARFVLWSGVTWILGVGALLAWGSRRQLLLLSQQYEVSFERMKAQADALRASEARLEARVVQRTAELTLANQELESFSYSVSHDLRAPLRAVDGFSQALLEDQGERLSTEGRELLHRIRAAATRMGQLIDDLLQLSRVSRADLRREQVDLSALARALADELQRREPGRDTTFDIAAGVEAPGDSQLLRVVMENLLDNAWKFTSKRAGARIEFFAETEGRQRRYVIRDNGVGFDMAYAGKLFSPFQRLHKATEFPGTGIGLATVQRILHRHGGRIEVEAAPGAGATFRFTLGEVSS